MRSVKLHIESFLKHHERPIILLGGGISHNAARKFHPFWGALGIPVMTTWNGADRIDSGHPLYFGRPNNFGMRYSNLLLQQADAIIAVGTRLGLQQTGFNWQSFAPLANIYQVDIDPAELNKGHPYIDECIAMDAEIFLDNLFRAKIDEDYTKWVKFCNMVKAELPQRKENQTPDGWIDPYEFIDWLSDNCESDDIIVPCSSGHTFTAMMQHFRQKFGQRIITNKGLASMGYGLPGAIGAAFTGRRTILVEGDGGFAQNLQELGTVAANQLPIKIFIFANDGYASIRSTQKNHFKGNLVGCDSKTALGIPHDWFKIFNAYGIRCVAGFDKSDMRDNKPSAHILPISKDQTFYPKISSIVLENGEIRSNPLHEMTPPLSKSQFNRLGKYLCRS